MTKKAAMPRRPSSHAVSRDGSGLAGGQPRVLLRMLGRESEGVFVVVAVVDVVLPALARLLNSIVDRRMIVRDPPMSREPILSYLASLCEC